MSDPQHTKNIEEEYNATKKVDTALVTSAIIPGLCGTIASAITIAHVTKARSSWSPLKKFFVPVGVGTATFCFSWVKIGTPIYQSNVESMPPSESRDILLKRLKGQMSRKEFNEKWSAIEQWRRDYWPVVNQGGEGSFGYLPWLLPHILPIRLRSKCS